MENFFVWRMWQWSATRGEVLRTGVTVEAETMADALAIVLSISGVREGDIDMRFEDRRVAR